MSECTDTYTHTHSHGVVIKVVNSASYSIFQRGLGSRLQSIRKYITEHFPPAEREGEGKRSKEKMMALKAAGIQHILHFKQRLLLYVMMYADTGNATMTLSLRDGCVI